MIPLKILSQAQSLKKEEWQHSIWFLIKNLSAKSKGKAIKSRSWGAAESKPSKHAVDRALIKTASSLAEQVKIALVKKSEEAKRKLQGRL